VSLYLNIFSAQFQCSDTALKITTNFSDDVYFLHAFHSKFTINANFKFSSLAQPVRSSIYIVSQKTV